MKKNKHRTPHTSPYAGMNENQLKDSRVPAGTFEARMREIFKFKDKR